MPREFRLSCKILSALAVGGVLLRALPSCGAEKDTESDAKVEGVLKMHGDDFQQCMTRERIFAHRLSGNVTIEFELDSQGTPFSSEIVSSSVKSERLETCLQNVIRGIGGFPKALGMKKTRKYKLPIDFPPPPPPRGDPLRRKDPIG